MIQILPPGFAARCGEPRWVHLAISQRPPGEQLMEIEVVVRAKFKLDAASRPEAEARMNSVLDRLGPCAFSQGILYTGAELFWSGKDIPLVEGLTEEQRAMQEPDPFE